MAKKRKSFKAFGKVAKKRRVKRRHPKKLAQAFCGLGRKAKAKRRRRRSVKT